MTQETSASACETPGKGPDPRNSPLSRYRDNGLLRQYFPKHTDLSVHTAQDLQRVAAELNQRPRLALADKTPEEAMRALLITSTTG
jgi:hypothetical protein